MKKHDVVLPLWVVIASLLLILILALVLWSKLRAPNLTLKVTETDKVREFLPSISGLARGAMLPGNSVQLLQNGAFFDAVIADMSRARVSINFETYIWWKSAIAERLAAVLETKAREGVKVKLLVDASGSSRGDEKVLERMAKAGVEVVRFHPFRLSNLGRVNNRDHRKIVVIDGTIGYTGGHGVGDEWTGNAQDKDHWRDTFVRVEGPIVHQLQATFFENWIEETGHVPAGKMYFPPLQPRGTTIAHVADSSPSPNVSPVQLLYYLAIEAAQKELIIQNPYFLPDRDGINALHEASRRGVKTYVMLPSVEVNDSPIVQHASHHHYGTLLKRGVRVFEYGRTLLHQKVMIVDGVWSTVGSTNFDDRSFEINDEVSIGMYDPAVAAQLKAAFNDDMRHAKEIKLDDWENRGWWHKLKDGAAYLLNEQL